MLKNCTLLKLKIVLFLLNGVPAISQTLPTPSISILGQMVVACQGDAIYLVSSANQGNIWSNGATTQTIAVTSTGTFNVQQVVGTNSSLPSAPVSVTIFPFVQATLNPLGTLCSNSSPVLLQGLPPGGIFSGNAITSNTSGIYFNPSLANIGSYNFVTYKINAPGYPLFCVDTAMIRINVNLCDGVESTAFNESKTVVYPNPASSNVFFRLPDSGIIRQIRISDVSGVEVTTLYNIENKTATIEIGKLTPGMYFAELLSGNNNALQRIHFCKIN